MKPSIKTILAALSFSSVLLFSCSKTADNSNPQSPDASVTALHNYGVLPMQPEQWVSVPTFSADIFMGSVRSNGLSYAPTFPGSYLLTSPAVRDQGQIGSCTGFCGSEAGEILYYYKSNSPAAATNLTVANGAATATTTQFSNPSALFGSSSALSPLFLYYVERCVINKQSITTDKGAYMVNIPQTLQGLSNNTGSGTPLTLNGTTFAGNCMENLYPYPSNGSNTSSEYTTPPDATAIVNATNFEIGVQSGTTGSSGTTNAGYYVINSTNLVADVKTALVNNKPVMMGFNVYDNSRYQYFEGLNTSSYTYNPLTANGKLISGVRLLGGHAVPIIGYINDASQPGGGVFICENSWSTGWGYYGYFYLPYSVLSSTTVVPKGSLYVAI
jgi:hypothetical protein